MDPILKQCLEEAFCAAAAKEFSSVKDTKHKFDAWVKQREDYFDKIKCIKPIDLRENIKSCSVIKLDKDFHIYVHGSKEKLTAGEDMEGNFIQIRYDVAHW